MNADGSPLLEQLRDIHAAGQPGWWPPAPGWWVLAILLALVLVLLLRKLMYWQSIRNRRKTWLRELETISRAHDPANSPHEYLAGMNRLFRAVAVKSFPGTASARLQGEPWVAWIRALLPEKTETEALSALARGPYEAVPAFDAKALQNLARMWVKLYG
jgi:hypothetical protein